MFNIFIDNLFFLAENTNVCDYADATKFYACDPDFHDLILRLEDDSVSSNEWYERNYIKLNQDRCDLLILGHKYRGAWENIGSCKIWESSDQKLLGVNIDYNSKFSHYI